MTSFDETLHPRESSGQFAVKENSEPEVGLLTAVDGATAGSPFPPLRDGLLAHEVHIKVWMRAPADRYGREDWVISMHRTDEDAPDGIGEELETHFIPDHQVPKDIGEEGQWTLDVAPSNIRRSAVASLRVRESTFDRDFGAYLAGEAAADREHFERTGKTRLRERAAND